LVEYLLFITDIHFSNKFLYLDLNNKLSYFRLNNFKLSFYFDPRSFRSTFYSARIILNSVVSKKFVVNRLCKYLNFMKRRRKSKEVNFSSMLSAVEAFSTLFFFFRYSLIRVSYELFFVGPLLVKELQNIYLIKTGFNRLFFLFNSTVDFFLFSKLSDISFYGFDISFKGVDSNIYLSKVLLSHYGCPIL
jgi:hypothetical protein